MWKLGEVLRVRRTNEVLEDYWCRTCKRRWQCRRALARRRQVWWWALILAALLVFSQVGLLVSLPESPIGEQESVY